MSTTLSPAPAVLPAASTDKAGRKTVSKRIAGVAVRFYKRTAAASWTMDFMVPGSSERVQESTRWTTLAEAERVAAGRIEEVKRLILNLGSKALVRGAWATVGEVLAVLDQGDKVVDSGTLRTYKSALLRLARTVDEVAPLEVGMDKALARVTVERLFSLGQGREGKGVNWVDPLPVNSGLNGTVRNALALMSHRERLMPGLKVPDVVDLRKLPKLREARHGFVPWPAGVFERMKAEVEGLRDSQPELWLINVCLRRLGLRAEELLAARREWIEQDAQGRWCLVVKDRADWQVLKHGKPRRLLLDAELAGVLLQKVGFLIADGLGETTRYDLIYRRHSEFLRRFIPDRTKSNHELRMHAASQVYMQQGLGAAAYFLGDSASTTERFYASWLGGAVGLGEDAVGAVG
jgi:integrase